MPAKRTAPAIPAAPGFRGAAFALLATLLLVACAPTRRHDGPGHATAPAARPELRAIFLVHGDGEYSYHDSTGRRLFADREAARRAREAGLSHPRAEVFLFHLRRGRSGWFKSHDGIYAHYQGGRLAAEGPYSRRPGDTAFEAEAAILRRHGEAATPVTHLAYFGHELPLRDQGGYFAAHPERPFSQARFARALGTLQPADSGKPYDALVLSTCYGGNPEMIAALRPLAKTIVASPAYLHLSYLDARALADPALRDAADTVATRSFERLRRGVHTEVTVATYDAETVRPPTAPTTRDTARAVWKDCAGTPGFDSASAAAGTRLLYRAPRFGAGRDVAGRSAWQCAL